MQVCEYISYNFRVYNAYLHTFFLLFFRPVCNGLETRRMPFKFNLTIYTIQPPLCYGICYC